MYPAGVPEASPAALQAAGDGAGCLRTPGRTRGWAPAARWAAEDRLKSCAQPISLALEARSRGRSDLPTPKSRDSRARALKLAPRDSDESLAGFRRIGRRSVLRFSSNRRARPLQDMSQSLREPCRRPFRRAALGIRARCGMYKEMWPTADFSDVTSLGRPYLADECPFQGIRSPLRGSRGGPRMPSIGPTGTTTMIGVSAQPDSIQ